ncbi:hypothetical protein M758_12G109500 [Ceratodon purpureus]|nr:hypothetical protein M758_12G109500 [Ceratodon purpureus]
MLPSARYTVRFNAQPLRRVSSYAGTQRAYQCARLISVFLEHLLSREGFLGEKRKGWKIRRLC